MKANSDGEKTIETALSTAASIFLDPNKVNIFQTSHYV